MTDDYEDELEAEEDYDPEPVYIGDEKAEVTRDSTQDDIPLIFDEDERKPDSDRQW